MSIALGDRAVRVTLRIGSYTNLVSDWNTSSDLEQKLGCHDTVKTKLKMIPDGFISRIRCLQSGMRSLVSTFCLRFGDGWILPTGLYDQFMLRFGALDDELKAAKQELVSRYPELLQEMEQRSGPFETHKRMPSDPVQFTSYYYSKLWIEPIGDATTWQPKMSPHVVAEIQQNFSNFLSEGAKEAVADALSRMHEALAHLVSRLQDPDAVFKEASVERVRELIELLPHFNITDDPQIMKLHDQLLNTSAALDAKSLRNSSELREEVTNQLRTAVDVITNLRNTDYNRDDT